MTNSTPVLSKPVRVQRKRTKGWRMPPNTVYVGRPSKFGNMFKIEKGGDSPAQAVEKYKQFTERLSDSAIRHIITKLKGKNLACWCPLDNPCHADILLELANEESNL